MSAAPVLAEEEAVQGQEATRESGVFAIEKAFQEKGTEGLASLADNEVEVMSGKIRELATIDSEIVKVAGDEAAALTKAKEMAVNALNAAKDSLIDDITAEVKKGIQAGVKSSSEKVIQLFPDKKEATPDKPVQEAAEEKVTAPDVPEQAQEELNEEEAIPLVKEKKKSVLLPEEPEGEMIIESSREKGAEKAAAIEVPAGRESAMEEIELSEEEAVEAAPIDYGQLISEEAKKKETAASDYQDAQKVLSEFKAGRSGALTPIESKYVAALESQLEMDRLASAHAENQINLYELNQKIEALAAVNENDPEIDKLIQQRNAKDVHSRNLAEQYDASVKNHDAVLGDYENSLQAFTQETVEEVEDEPPLAVGGGGDSTGGSYGGSDFEKRALKLTPEDEASFEARQAGVGVEKKPGLLKRAAASVGRAGRSAVNPEMKLSAPAGGKKKKKKKGFFRWMFGGLFK